MNGSYLGNLFWVIMFAFFAKIILKKVDNSFANMTTKMMIPLLLNEKIPSKLLFEGIWGVNVLLILSWSS
jgi:hypothetical protein